MMVIITRLRPLIAGCSSDNILRGYLESKMNQTARLMLNKGMWACAGATIKYWTPCIYRYYKHDSTGSGWWIRHGRISISTITWGELDHFQCEAP